MMSFFFGGTAMVGRRLFCGVLILITIIVIVTGLLFSRLQSANSIPKQVQENVPAVNLGFVYLPVTQRISAYYELGLDSGALVTEVVKGSLLDRAGIKAGDVITSFNGIKIGEGTPLLGMIRACSPNAEITLEVWSNNSLRLVQIIQSEK